MSQEIIELHERGVAALNARELSDELAAETLAPGFRVENAATAVTDKTYCDVEGLREWVRDIFEGLDDDARYETQEIIADGEDFVVARGPACRPRRPLGSACRAPLGGGHLVRGRQGDPVRRLPAPPRSPRGRGA
jgi:hypothetical protein